MSPRRTRVQRIISIREKQRDEKVKTLADRERSLAEANHKAEGEKRRLFHATAERERLANEGADAKSWLEADEWLAARAALHDIAKRQAERASVAVDHARDAVVEAQVDVRRVEMLSERLEAKERADEERVARRLEDEIAAQRFEQVLERWKPSR